MISAEELEVLIRWHADQQRLMYANNSRDLAREHFKRMAELISQRSQEKVREMETEQNLS